MCVDSQGIVLSWLERFDFACSPSEFGHHLRGLVGMKLSKIPVLNPWQVLPWSVLDVTALCQS